MYSYTCTRKNDEETLIHTTVTLGEHETKSLHLCQITTWHTTQVYKSKINLNTSDSGLHHTIAD